MNMLASTPATTLPLDTRVRVTMDTKWPMIDMFANVSYLLNFGNYTHFMLGCVFGIRKKHYIASEL